MKNEQNDIIRLDDLKIGEKYFITALSRVVRVERRGKADLKQRSLKGDIEVVTNAPTVIVRGTIPHKPMEGLVSKKQAVRNKIILDGNLSQTVDEDFDDREWEETWAERTVPRLITNIGQPARLDAKNPVREVYCVTDNRTNERIRRCNRFDGNKIEGIRIENPPLLFHDEQEAPVEMVVETVQDPVIPDPLVTMNIQQLRAEAKKRGMDVSDITGEGATAAIRERLNNGILV